MQVRIRAELIQIAVLHDTFQGLDHLSSACQPILGNASLKKHRMCNDGYLRVQMPGNA